MEPDNGNFDASVTIRGDNNCSSVIFAPQLDRKPYDDMYKILLVGAPSVGKSALIHRFCDNEFLKEHKPSLVEYGFFTAGVDLKVRDIELKDHRVKLKMWDTSGEERFRSVVTAYCRGSGIGVMVVFDISDMKSFAAAKKWVTLLAELRRKMEGWDPIIVLVGNKEDLLAKRAISKGNGEQLAIENKLLYMETSAKSGLNVFECFRILSSCIKHYKDKDMASRRQSYGPILGTTDMTWSPECQANYEKVIRELEEGQRRNVDVNSKSICSADSSMVENSSCIPKSRARLPRGLLCSIL